MRILITGSSGFLGAHCVNYFRKNGHTVTGVDLVKSETTDIVADARVFVQQQHQRLDKMLHHD